MKIAWLVWWSFEDEYPDFQIEEPRHYHKCVPIVYAELKDDYANGY